MLHHSGQTLSNQRVHDREVLFLGVGLPQLEHAGQVRENSLRTTTKQDTGASPLSEGGASGSTSWALLIVRRVPCSRRSQSFVPERNRRRDTAKLGTGRAPNTKARFTLSATPLILWFR